MSCMLTSIVERNFSYHSFEINKVIVRIKEYSRSFWSVLKRDGTYLPKGCFEKSWQAENSLHVCSLELGLKGGKREKRNS